MFTMLYNTQETPARRFCIMSSRTLYRLSGGTLIAASLLILISSVLSNALYPGHNTTPQQDMSLPWLLVTLVILIGAGSPHHQCDAPCTCGHLHSTILTD